MKDSCRTLCRRWRYRFVMLSGYISPSLQVSYSVYWGTCFFTFITWVLAVSVAAQNGWAKLAVEGYALTGIGASCSSAGISSTEIDYDDICSMCEYSMQGIRIKLLISCNIYNM